MRKSNVVKCSLKAWTSAGGCEKPEGKLGAGVRARDGSGPTHVFRRTGVPGTRLGSFRDE